MRIANPVALHPTRPYGAILGLAPSKGARSPVLWRAAFAALGIEADFHPFDVAPLHLAQVVAALKADARFIGGAVAVPFKEDIISLLDEVDGPARAIGAANALWRTADGGLAGANTDGLAARDCLVEILGPLAGTRVQVLGLGGAGKAVAATLAAAGADILLWNRTQDKAEAYARHLSELGMMARAVGEPQPAAILVNATSVGFRADCAANDDLPVSSAYLDRLSQGALVFDVVYQPDRTALLRAAEARGLRTLGGRRMNLLQAAIAFRLCFADADGRIVAAAMEGASS